MTPHRPLTLEAAVAILNARQHREFGGWRVEGSTPYAKGEYYYDNLEAFEAIAVAEKYLRDEAATESPELATDAPPPPAGPCFSCGRPVWSEGTYLSSCPACGSIFV